MERLNLGSGGQKAHQAIAIAPAPTEVYELDTEGSSPDYGIENLVAALGPDDYDSIVAMVHSAADGGFDSGEHPLDHLSDLKDADLQVLTKAYLTNLSDSDLHQLAATNGFEHPILVGFSDSDQHPLVHWLDPAYPPDTATKAKIQAKAVERYQALQAGETIAGMILADVHAAEADLGITPLPPTWDTWDATPAEVASAMADVTNQVSGLGTLPYTEKAGGVAALVTAENILQTANCPDLGQGLDELKASAAQLVSAHTKSATGPNTSAALHEAGLLSEPEATWLSPTEALAASRYASGADQVGDLKTVATSRAEAIAQLQTHMANGIGTASSFAGIDTSMETGRQQLLDTINTTQEAFALTHQAHSWGASDSGAIHLATLHSKHLDTQAHKALSKDFRTWAKTQKLADLRAVAETAGLAAAKTAGTRAEIQSYLAGQWDTTIDQAAIEASVKAKASAKKATAPPAASSTTPAVPTPVATTPTTGVAAVGAIATASGPGRFTGKLGTLTAKLKAHQQINADLPTRTGAAVVESHSWGAGQSWTKGSHEASLHTGPDGSEWLFKPDKSARGARAYAESAASGVFSRVGVPGVDVHVVTIGNRIGAIQPLVKGASNLEGTPSSWSQTDVDSMVRLHVAAWAVGDHDGHTSNVMRSASGAIFAVDQGQAFKFFGRDKLDHGWHPATNYGTPVYHEAYSAHQQGGLGIGVQVRAKAALPVIKAFEAIPDGQYRTMLTPTATEGVKHGVHWVEPMRKAAQKRLGRTKVTNAEIVGEFLTAAVERKTNLRRAFGGFFDGLGVSDAPHLTWVK